MTSPVPTRAFLLVALLLARDAAPAAEVKTLPLGGGASLTLVRIPAGSFLMGSPRTEAGRFANEDSPTTVTLTSDFWLGETEVTVAQYQRFTEATGYRTQAEKEGGAIVLWEDEWRTRPWATWHSPGYSTSPEFPVTCVSWNDAIAFCDWLGKTTGMAMTLPTEAQWEYACRAGAPTAYCWGNDVRDGDGWANAADAAALAAFPDWTTTLWSDGMTYPGPVCSFRPNAFGIHDMHGNVFEWCRDNFEERLPGGTVANRFVPPQGTAERALRGGGWIYPPDWMRSAFRGKHTPEVRAASLGFRVAAAGH